jgi:hypothetical protein
MATSKNALRLSCAFGLFALSVAVAQGGCAVTPISAICDKVCDCEICSDEVLKSCEDQGGFAEAKASSLGCKAEFDAHNTCLMKLLGCKTHVTLGTGCDTQADALNQCTKDVVPFVAACELAADRLATCGVTVEAGSGMKPLCIGLFLCQATCINTASCDELLDAFSGAPTSTGLNFLACKTKCMSGG